MSSPCTECVISLCGVKFSKKAGFAKVCFAETLTGTGYTKHQMEAAITIGSESLESNPSCFLIENSQQETETDRLQLYDQLSALKQTINKDSSDSQIGMHLERNNNRKDSSMPMLKAVGSQKTQQSKEPGKSDETVKSDQHPPITSSSKSVAPPGGSGSGGDGRDGNDRNDKKKTPSDKDDDSDHDEEEMTREHTDSSAPSDSQNLPEVMTITTPPLQILPPGSLLRVPSIVESGIESSDVEGAFVLATDTGSDADAMVERRNQWFVRNDAVIPETHSESEATTVPVTQPVSHTTEALPIETTHVQNQFQSPGGSTCSSGLQCVPSSSKYKPLATATTSDTTMSSLTECSSDDIQPSAGTPRTTKRLAPRKLAMSSQTSPPGGTARKAGKAVTSVFLDVSVDDNDATRNQENPHIMDHNTRGHASPAVPMSFSQQDLFEEVDSATNIEDEGRIVSTPAQLLQSLQFSGQPMLVPDTEDDAQSVEYIPPSPDVYGPTPIIIPSSPTCPSSSETDENNEVTVIRVGSTDENQNQPPEGSADAPKRCDSRSNSSTGTLVSEKGGSKRRHQRGSNDSDQSRRSENVDGMTGCDVTQSEQIISQHQWPMATLEETLDSSNGKHSRTSQEKQEVKDHSEKTQRSQQKSQSAMTSPFRPIVISPAEEADGKSKKTSGSQKHPRVAGHDDRKTRDSDVLLASSSGQENEDVGWELHYTPSQTGSTQYTDIKMKDPLQIPDTQADIADVTMNDPSSEAQKPSTAADQSSAFRSYVPQGGADNLPPSSGRISATSQQQGPTSNQKPDPRQRDPSLFAAEDESQSLNIDSIRSQDTDASFPMFRLERPRISVDDEASAGRTSSSVFTRVRESTAQGTHKTMPSQANSKSSSSCDDPFVFRDTQEEEALQQKTETSTRPKMASPMETSTRPHSQQHTPESTTLAAPRSPYYPLKAAEFQGTEEIDDVIMMKEGDDPVNSSHRNLDESMTQEYDYKQHILQAADTSPVLVLLEADRGHSDSRSQVTDISQPGLKTGPSQTSELSKGYHPDQSSQSSNGPANQQQGNGAPLVPSKEVEPQDQIKSSKPPQKLTGDRSEETLAGHGSVSNQKDLTERHHATLVEHSISVRGHVDDTRIPQTHQPKFKRDRQSLKEDLLGKDLKRRQQHGTGTEGSSSLDEEGFRERGRRASLGRRSRPPGRGHGDKGRDDRGSSRGGGGGRGGLVRGNSIPGENAKFRLEILRTPSIMESVICTKLSNKDIVLHHTETQQQPTERIIKYLTEEEFRDYLSSLESGPLSPTSSSRPGSSLNSGDLADISSISKSSSNTPSSKCEPLISPKLHSSSNSSEHHPSHKVSPMHLSSGEVSMLATPIMSPVEDPVHTSTQISPAQQSMESGRDNKGDDKTSPKENIDDSFVPAVKRRSTLVNDPGPAQTDVTRILDEQEINRPIIHSDKTTSSSNLATSASLFTTPENKKTSSTSDQNANSDKSTKSASLATSASLFTSPDLKKASSTSSDKSSSMARTSSGLPTSASLFTSSSTGPDKSPDEFLFQKPEGEALKPRRRSSKQHIPEGQVTKAGQGSSDPQVNPICQRSPPGGIALEGSITSLSASTKQGQSLERLDDHVSEIGQKKDNENVGTALDGKEKRKSAFIKIQKKSGKEKPVEPVETPSSPETQVVKVTEEPERSSSPEIPMQMDLLVLSPASSSPSKAVTSADLKSEDICHVMPQILPPGSAVMAKWSVRDDFYYPGRILSCQKNDKYQVLFDDGNKRQVKMCHVIGREKLATGQSVMVEGADGYYDSGIVLSCHVKSDEIIYNVELDSGERKRYPRAQVILSSDQVANLIDDVTITGLPLSPGPTASQITASTTPATVSLDNIVDGKRRRTPLVKDPGTPKSASKRQKTASSTKVDEETKPQPTRSSRRGCKRQHAETVEPKATSTPTPKGKAPRKKPRDEVASSVPETGPSGVQKSDDSAPGSPSRVVEHSARTELFADPRDAAVSSSLFTGCVFLLTYVKRSAEQKKQEKKLARSGGIDASSTTEESSVDEEEALPYDKYQLRDLIVSEGGTVIPDYDKQKIEGAANCFLISDMYQRTTKYFHSLAAGIPCVSHIWIRDCCRQGKFLDWKSYILPAGVSLETNKIIEWNKRGSDLVDMRVMVSSSEREFSDTWTAILTTARCDIISKLPSSASGDHLMPEVIVSDGVFSVANLRRIKQLKIPVVSTEWVIQSLINGQRMFFDSHPKYFVELQTKKKS